MPHREIERDTHKQSNTLFSLIEADIHQTTNIDNIVITHTHTLGSIYDLVIIYKHFYKK